MKPALESQRINRDKKQPRQTSPWAVRFIVAGVLLFALFGLGSFAWSRLNAAAVVGRPGTTGGHRARQRHRSGPDPGRRAYRQPHAASAQEVLTLLLRLNQEFGKTVIMVTHDPHAARTASKIRYLEKGLLLPENQVPEDWVMPPSRIARQA